MLDVCVLVGLCLYVCAKKFVSGYLTKKLTDLNEIFDVCCNQPRIENLPLSDISPKIGKLVSFAIL